MTTRETETELLQMGRDARDAAKLLRQTSRDIKDTALRAAARALRTRSAEILTANAEDIAAAHDLSPALRDRLVLDATRIEAVARGLDDIAALPDPVDRELARWTRPNGLDIRRIATPIGVIGIIYESRPNVTADAGALCLKSGNAVILRGGSESLRSSLAIHAALEAGLQKAGLPKTAIQLIRTTDRAAVGAMLKGLNGTIDLIVPRGGKSLVARVDAEARVPVFAHLEGLVHVYVDRDADLAKAVTILRNSKLRRTSICGAAETLLVDRACAPTHLAPLVTMLLDAGCAVRGDAETQAVDPRVTPATEDDWSREYLDAIISARVVDGLESALAHIARYGSHHTDCIITEDAKTAERFLREVDSAIVIHNASTQFADGGEFGFGGEIGIATGRMHARGPVGLDQLTTFKYCVHGNGQVRP